MGYILENSADRYGSFVLISQLFADRVLPPEQPTGETLRDHHFVLAGKCPVGVTAYDPEVEHIEKRCIGNDQVGFEVAFVRFERHGAFAPKPGGGFYLREVSLQGRCDRSECCVEIAF